MEKNGDSRCIKPDTYAALTKMLSEKIVSFPDTLGCLVAFICYWTQPYELCCPFMIAANTNGAQNLLGMGQLSPVHPFPDSSLSGHPASMQPGYLLGHLVVPPTTGVLLVHPSSNSPYATCISPVAEAC